MKFQLREAKPADAEAAGRICYETFTAISTEHGFPPDLPAPEVGIQPMTLMTTGLYNEPSGAYLASILY